MTRIPAITRVRYHRNVPASPLGSDLIQCRAAAELGGDNDSRATFSYSEERILGYAHVIGRRIGTHPIFIPPPDP